LLVGCHLPSFNLQSFNRSIFNALLNLQLAVSVLPRRNRFRFARSRATSTDSTV
jgi:hypothetical protein